ncbi:MAG: hypothetical protein MJZ16_09430 [Bacteroidales bacterium]|nr:hypothetical protein [Bacteroidales bacterium]
MRLSLISALLLVCVNMFAQAPLSRLNVTVSQAGEAFTASEIDYNYNPREGVSGNVIVDGSVDIKPTFAGGDAKEFSIWMASKLIEAMDRESTYNIHLNVNFVITAEGTISDIHVVPIAGENGKTAWEKLVVDNLSKANYWSPEMHYGTKFNTPMALHIYASQFMPNRGVVLIDSYMDYFFDSLSERLVGEKNKKETK